MSRRRSAASLRATQRLAKNALADLRAQRIGRQEVDAPPEPGLEIQPQPRQREEPNRSIEFDDQVDVAVARRFVARGGSEQKQRAHTMAVELRTMSCKFSEDGFALLEHRHREEVYRTPFPPSPCGAPERVSGAPGAPASCGCARPVSAIGGCFVVLLRPLGPMQILALPFSRERPEYVPDARFGRDIPTARLPLVKPFKAGMAERSA